MGTVEIDDQVDGVRHLIAQGLVDPARVGVYGWSYGGYASLLCLARAPELFRAAVSGAPVTEWEGYDTHYTERYMATPAENPEGYAGGSVIAQVGQIRGRLLLVHGLVDENVHFRHAARLIDAMVKAGVEHELLLFPDERHMPRSERDRAMMEARLLRFFDEALAARAPQGA
jgi:dipeptidyl-peptidase-4